MICPTWPMDTLRGTASVDAPVPWRFAVSQLRRGGMQANEKDSAMTKKTGVWTCGRIGRGGPSG